MPPASSAGVICSRSLRNETCACASCIAGSRSAAATRPSMTRTRALVRGARGDALGLTAGRRRRPVVRESPGELADRILRYRLQQVRAGREVVGEVALADARRLADLGLRQLMGAALCEQAQRGFEDAVADVHLVSLPNGA